MNNFLKNFTAYESIGEALEKAYQKYKLANSTFWVTSLSFYTIMSLVPIFAILLSLGSWFGARDYFIDRINEFSPLKTEALDWLLVFSDNLLKSARNGFFAGVGFVFLGLTFIKMFSLIENSFNDIWHIKKPRSFVRKISDYIAFLIFIPLAFIVLNGAFIFLLSNLKGISILYAIVSKIIPLISVAVFFTLLYMVMPNTNVKFIPAFIAGFTTSVIFFIFQYIFIYIQFLIHTYNAIYGSFSVIFIFLLWIRIAWFMIILGVHLSYLLQNPSIDLLLDGGLSEVSFNTKFYITLKIIRELSKRYIEDREAPTADELKNIIKTSAYLVDSSLETLIKLNYIVVGENLKAEKIYVLIKNIDKHTINELLNDLLNLGEKIYNLENEEIDEIEKIIFSKNYNITLRELGGKNE